MVVELKGIFWSHIQPLVGKAKVRSLLNPYLRIIFCNVVDPDLWVFAKANDWMGLHSEKKKQFSLHNFSIENQNIVPNILTLNSKWRMR